MRKDIFSCKLHCNCFALRDAVQVQGSNQSRIGSNVIKAAPQHCNADALITKTKYELELTRQDIQPIMSNSADQLFTKFCNSISFPEIQQLFKEICSQLGIDSNQDEGFYASIRKSLKHWKAVSIFKLLDARASMPEYDGQRACAGKRVLVVGAGPVGLRGAIELALLGARVDLVEKREEFTRNNCLHLWQFCIHDLRSLGAKILYSRFAYGTIEHISKS